LRLNMWTNEKM